jgi:tetratricopeptide (TPR) repeat protein
MSIYGLGGGGKTAVALELAYRMMAEHSPFLVFWVPAINRETFEIAYREIGTRLRIPGIASNNADVKQLVKNSLNSDDFGDWLMVIDNADDPGVLLDSTNDDPRAGRLYDYLPHSDRGSILFTTRSRKVAERLTQSNILELKDMTKAEAKQLMAQRISDKALLEEDATGELLELLTYLPLAIVQAAAFINSNQVSMSDYVSLFNHAETTREILSERFEDPSRYRETESTMARTWQISFNQIRKQDQLAADYLSFIACIDRINIPQSLLPIEGTAVQRLKALGTLTGYAFISERQQGSQQLEGERFFDVHRLVQKATVWWLKEHNNWTAWAETAYGRLEELVPYGEHEGRSKWISYIPHAIHVADLHRTLSETGRASLLDRIGRCQATLGQYAAAEETHQRVLSLRRKNLGNEDVSTLTSMNEVGRALNGQGKYEEAEAMDRETLALIEKVLGREHPSTLTSMANLAATYWNRGRWDEAEELEVQVMETRKKVLGLEHPDILTSMANLAATYWSKGRWDEAEELEVQVMETRKRVLGPEHPDILTSMANLAATYWNKGRWDEAEELEVQVMETRKRVLGPEHPSTLSSMAKLAATYNKKRR